MRTQFPLETRVQHNRTHTVGTVIRHCRGHISKVRVLWDGSSEVDTVSVKDIQQIGPLHWDYDAKGTYGERVAAKMVRIVPRDALGGIELHMAKRNICWEVEGEGKLPKDAAYIRREIARAIDGAYARGKKDGR